MKKVQDRWERISRLLFQIFIWILEIILFPVILIILAVLFIWKNILLRIVVKFLKPKLLGLLNCRDGFYAVDRFWEDSRSSLGLILVLNGNVCIDKFREEFIKKVLDATKNATEEKMFTRLTQIPTSFGGYYFWQKANYFLIHEHIRQIEQPIDETGLKKFAGTVMTLPFPNKRPLWEILVFPSFNTNCSAVVIRVHQAVTDPEGLMHLVASLSNGKIKEIHGDQPHEVTSVDKPTTLEKVRETLKIPRSAYTFCASFFKVSSLNFKSLNGGDSVASWNEMHELSFRKVQKSQNLKYSATVGLSVFTGAIASSIKAWTSTQTNNDTESEIKQSETNNAGLYLDMNILFPVQLSKNVKERLTNSQGFAMIKTCEDGNSNNSISRLKHIDSQIQNSLENNDPQISIGFLKILSLLPRHLLRYILSQPSLGGTLLFQEFRSEITTASEASADSAGSTLDLISIGEYELLDLVPLCGLQWVHTAVAVATLKFQNKVTMSLIVNSGLLKSNEKQKAVDEVVLTLPDELDSIFEDGKDEHGFISIPII